METIAWLLIGSYAICCVILTFTWFNIEKQVDHLASTQTTMSVIIPVRNEATNITNLLQVLANQSVNKEKYEVIVVNDASTDGTKELVESYIQSTDMRIKLINLPEKTDNRSPKKRALTEAIKMATGELIVTTDGDCTMGKKWLAALVTFYNQTGAYFISSPVSFRNKKTTSLFGKIWHSFQVIEFGSLIGAGACAIKMGAPNMCSGANIAYKKAIFFDVNGYEGNEHIASGDDEFLMHKIADKYPGKVQYLKNKDATVETSAHATIASFYQQRRRWASKWRFYQNWQPTALAIYIALVNALTVWAICTGQINLILLKFSVEFVFLSAIVLFLDKENTVPFIPLTQLIYPFYVLIIAVAVQFKSKYIWKGRKLA